MPATSSIFETLRRIRRLSIIHQVDHLRNLIKQEPVRSIRRGELEAALKAIVTKQIRKENRAA